MALYSIITVTYNDFQNFQTTHESVKSQTYKNFQWIVINGKKGDDTDNYIQSIEGLNLKYLAEKDSGLYDAMNKGILRAEGEFLIFMNSGDVFSNEIILSEIAEQIDSSDIKPNFIFGDSNEITPSNELLYRKSRSIHRKSIGMFTHHQTMFYDREIIFKENIFYNQIYSIASDYQFTLQFLKFSKHNLYLPFSICNFKQGGLSHQNWRIGIKQQYKIRKEILNMNGIKNNIILFLQNVLHAIRFRFSSLYNLYRFKKN
mgnify:FL=1